LARGSIRRARRGFPRAAAGAVDTAPAEGRRHLLPKCPAFARSALYAHPSVLRQREREQRAARRDRDVLPAIHGVAHRTGVDLAAERLAPLELARARVEREEIPFTAAAEHEVAG